MPDAETRALLEQEQQALESLIADIAARRAQFEPASEAAPAPDHSEQLGRIEEALSQQLRPTAPADDGKLNALIAMVKALEARMDVPEPECEEKPLPKRLKVLSHDSRGRIKEVEPVY